MSERDFNSDELNIDRDIGEDVSGADSARPGKAKTDVPKTKSLGRMKLSAKFWNRFDWLNKFRHWYIGVGSFFSGIFRVLAAWQTIAILGTILLAFYLFTAFYTGKGEFVIQVDRPLANEGFILSEDGDFSEWLVTLRNKSVDGADNINITDIARNVKSVNGNHNGKDYVAYTFYLKNRSDKTKSYAYKLHIMDKYKGAEQATWLMVYQNGKQVMYAAPNKNGHEECQYAERAFPFVEDALNPEYQMSTITNEEPGYITQDVIDYHDFEDLDGIFQLRTVPFESEDNVCTVYRPDIGPDEVDKYTVVIWLEGEDPECVNDILGGYVEFRMKFYLVEEDEIEGYKDDTDADEAVKEIVDEVKEQVKDDMSD